MIYTCNTKQELLLIFPSIICAFLQVLTGKRKKKKKKLEISKKPQKIDSIGEFMRKTPKRAPTIFLLIFFIAQTCTQSNKVI